MIKSVHHAQISVAPDQEAEAREFYCQTLGFEALAKPESLAGRGGFWCQLGAFQIHIGIEKNPVNHASKAHLAYAVDHLEHWRQKLKAAGLTPQESVPIPGMQRFECRDPFGNRMEFLELTPQGSE